MFKKKTCQFQPNPKHGAISKTYIAKKQKEAFVVLLASKIFLL